MGKEHVPEVKPRYTEFRSGGEFRPHLLWHERVCTRCGKVLDYLLDEHGQKKTLREHLLLKDLKEITGQVDTGECDGV